MKFDIKLLNNEKRKIVIFDAEKTDLAWIVFKNNSQSIKFQLLT